ncbi:AAC(3)-I family aminoglycoside 3-N-acetyltransferase [Runella rosea]|uniref:AAC(3)-I family aminoglycoside 3-N-acetyltransferase n=1 Tax=Runella rosea TaxID=2259595 RepID=A0A344TQV6_9BACT|nr:GNAT family N-acetyltransferase [Runella rosea]AXE21027.1 AAC(3)-I family aminoglycoside 3-N-acetyltransferase [Runella rosea]
MKIDIQILTEQQIGEMTELISVFQKVFEMDEFIYPNENHLNKLLKSPNFLAVTAKQASTIVAGMTVYILDPYYSTKPLAFIYDLAVLRDYQRQGIGKRIIDFFKSYCQQQGFEEVFVFADQVDEEAIEFYRTTKPTHESQTVYFNYVLENHIEAKKSF